jgi:hypothetical protein
MIDQIKKELEDEQKLEKAYTENGALAYRTSGKNLVDLNFGVASYRSLTEREIYEDFIKAFTDDNELAIKWLYFARDIRGGLGERRLFRTVLKKLIQEHGWSEKFEVLFRLIPEYGRWDDLLIVFEIANADGIQFVSNLIKKQIEKDIEDMHNEKAISICAKWLPSEGASAADKKVMARKLASLWGLSNKNYRKKINELKAYLDVVEIKTSSNKWENIDYQKVPSKANLKYKMAFYRHDGDRYSLFLDAVEKGEKKINSSVNFPHDVVYQYVKDTKGWGERLNPYDKAIEQLWKALPDYKISNTLVVADGSGSMTSEIANSNVRALDVANALAIYCSERNTEPYRNKYITFSDKPQYVEFNEKDSLHQKLLTALRHNEVASTDIEKVFKLILKTAINNNLSNNEIVKSVMIISDMEFNAATTAQDNTLFDDIKDLYAQHNYDLPRLVFWNVNSRTMTIPVQENTNGVALVSGFSPSILNLVMSDKLDPYEVLVETLNSERYKEVVWKN